MLNYINREERHMTKRNIFSPETKREAASLVLDKGYSIEEACTAFGASNSAVRSWAKKIKGDVGI